MKLTFWGPIISILVSSIVFGDCADRANAATITLYDGASFSGTPDNLPNPYLSFTNIGSGTQTASNGQTTLDTSGSQSTYAGYSNYNTSQTPVNPVFPTLDSNTGYTLSFAIKIDSQTNSSPARSGFSIITLDNDKRGIEIGFRSPNTLTNTPDIFSQTLNGANFVVGEQNNNLNGIFTSLNTYDLNVLGNSYTLSTNGNTLLSGSLRNYTAGINSNPPLTTVYGLPNFIFLGDDTSSAGANVRIQKIILTTTPKAVPEPSGVLGMTIAIVSGAIVKWKLYESGDLAKL